MSSADKGAEPTGADDGSVTPDASPAGAWGAAAEGEPALVEPALMEPAHGGLSDGDGADSDPAEGDLAESDPAEGAPAERDPTEGELADAGPGTPTPTGASAPPRATAAGRVWVGLAVGVVLIVLLIIFIAENSGRVTIKFLGASGSISLGLAMLAAAVVGALITLLVGTTRILQLRREVRRNARHK